MRGSGVWDIGSSALMSHDITQKGRSEVGVPYCTPGRGVGIGVFCCTPSRRSWKGLVLLQPGQREAGIRMLLSQDDVVASSPERDRLRGDPWLFGVKP